MCAVVADLDLRQPSPRLPRSLTGRTVVQRTSPYPTWGFPNDQHVTRLRRRSEPAARRSTLGDPGTAADPRRAHVRQQAGIG